MRIGYTFLLTCILKSIAVVAQPYVEGGKTRHRFAQVNLGLDQRLFFGKGSKSASINPFGKMEEFELNNQLETRLIIGGTHFWGHADFYIAIPVLSLGKSGFSTGVETGGKYFPWRIKQNKLRPYLGMALLPTRFQQGSGADLIRFKYPLTTGAVYNYKNNLFELGLGYHYSNANEYYINEFKAYQINTQAFWVSLGCKIMFDGTLSAEKHWQSGKTKILTDTLAALNRLNGFTLALGPSSAFFLKPSSHNKEVAPFVDNHKSFSIFPDFGIGYYFHQPDLQFNLSYRFMNNQIKAYDFRQIAKRKSLSFETFKFISDYHGFAVFVGPVLSYEWLIIDEVNHQQQVTSARFYGLKPGIVFGWDIRPNRLQSWYIRTNLRYFPNMGVEMPGDKNIPFDMLEFNFFQLVVFPGRLI
jgi:hypothetical protein